MSYFDQRMDSLGFDAAKHTAYFKGSYDAMSKKEERPIFEEDSQGNILIHFFDLGKNIHTWDRKKSSRHQTDIQPYGQIRFANPDGDNRYAWRTKGEGVLPYHSLKVCDAWLSKKKIKKLYIIEGPFKAFVMGEFGLHAIAIPGIQQWKPKYSKRLFKEIEQVIKDCEVDEVIWVTDADTLHVKYAPGKDLYRRPANFYQSVCMFRELCMEFKINLYFAHIKTSIKEKGFDDLIFSLKKTEQKKLIKEIGGYGLDFKYINKIEITSASYPKLLEYFKITNAKQFFNEYREIIKDQPFIFKGAQYRFDDLTQTLERKRRREAALYVVIGNDIYEKATRPTENGKYEAVLLPRKKDAIKLKHKIPMSVVDEILMEAEYFDGLENFPGHINYEEFRESKDEKGNISRWYNSYHRLTHAVYPGETKFTMDFIKHIFGTHTVEYSGKKIPYFELGLDYIQILYKNPKQILPILSLISSERQTGKTTFWDWMRDIFQENVVSCDARELDRQFTSFTAGKLLVVVEEANVDKSSLNEKIKRLVTDKKTKLERKNKDAQQIRNILKIGMSSNSEEGFAKIDSDETRYWVLQIPTVTKKIFDLKEKLMDEIPAFLHFLQKRKLVTKNDDRAWFDPKLIHTKALDKIKSASRWEIEILIEDSVRNYMRTFNLSECRLSSGDLKELINDRKIGIGYINKALTQKFKKEAKHAVYQMHRWIEHQGKISPSDNSISHNIHTIKKKSNAYRFYADEFFKNAEILFCSEKQLLELEEKYHRQPMRILSVDHIKEELKHHEPNQNSFLNKIDQVLEHVPKENLKHFWDSVESVLHDSEKISAFIKFINSAKNIYQNATEQS